MANTWYFKDVRENPACDWEDTDNWWDGIGGIGNHPIKVPWMSYDVDENNVIFEPDSILVILDSGLGGGTAEIYLYATVAEGVTGYMESVNSSLYITEDAEVLSGDYRLDVRNEGTIVYAKVTGSIIQEFTNLNGGTVWDGEFNATWTNSSGSVVNGGVFNGDGSNSGAMANCIINGTFTNDYDAIIGSSEINSLSSGESYGGITNYFSIGDCIITLTGGYAAYDNWGNSNDVSITCVADNEGGPCIENYYDEETPANMSWCYIVGCNSLTNGSYLTNSVVKDCLQFHNNYGEGSQGSCEMSFIQAVEVTSSGYMLMCAVDSELFTIVGAATFTMCTIRASDTLTIGEGILTSCLICASSLNAVLGMDSVPWLNSGTLEYSLDGIISEMNEPFLIEGIAAPSTYMGDQAAMEFYPETIISTSSSKEILISGI
jgi:hypothetical protein